MNTATTKLSASTFFARLEPPSRWRSSQLTRLHGDLDAAAHETLCHAAAQTGEHDLIVDLTRVSFIDAAGLGCLLNLRHSHLSRGRTVTLRGASPRVRKLFAVVGLDSLLTEPPPPDPAPTGRQPKVTSVRTRVRPVSARNDTGHLLWASRLFAITAWVCLEPRGVDVLATGDFSSPSAATVLQRALTRLAHFDAPIRIDSQAVTNAAPVALGILQAHRSPRRVAPAAGTSRQVDPSVAAAPTAPRAA